MLGGSSLRWTALIMKFLTALAVATVATCAPVVAQAQDKAPAAQRIVLPTDVHPERYDIRIVPDAGKLAFTGHADITVTVLKPTDRIVLNAADLKLGAVKLSGQGATPRLVHDEKQQTTAFVFDRPLATGRYTLSIDYTGQIFQQPSGLFALDYEGQDGAKQRALFTQFENSDARRFAPMWDEPGIRSVFALTVEAPQGQMVVSNMPVARQAPAAGGRTAFTFADSPAMSSYLLFMAMGDFERVSQTVAGVDVGVVVRRGDTEKAKYALDATARLLPYYNDWFATPYPLPKLDLVAGPGRSQFFSAMENWGAIFYFDHAILIDPKLSTEDDKQQVFVTVAHEVAHQWFGNLVTMSWWDDLWLNESFASWMENKATDHFHPEWKIWLSTQAGQQGAMRLDSRAGTHPVITDIPDVFAAATAFDTITYQKGQAIVRMFEAYVGEDAFRDGVRRYIKKHSYGNTVSTDLWAALDEASPGKPVSPVAKDFTSQAGVPLIQAREADGGIALTQSRFGVDDSQRTPRAWQTPVTVQAVGGGPVWNGLVSATSPQSVRVPAPAVVNAGQTGYFRTAYSPELWAKLAPQFAKLAPADQLGLLYDSRALGEAGLAPMGDFLTLAKNAPADADPVVLQTLASNLAALDSLLAGRPSQATFRRFVIGRLSPVAARLGWDARPGEADNDSVLRRAVLTTLGDFGDAATIAEARRRFARYLQAPDSLTGASRQAVLAVVAANADARTWDQLHGLAKSSKDVSDRARLYGLLGDSNDPALVKKTLDLVLTGELTTSEVPAIIAAVAEAHPDAAYDFAVAHRAKVDEMLEPTSRTTFYAETADASRAPAMVEKLDRLAATVPASSRGEIEKAKAAIRYRTEVIRDRVPELEAWLKTNGG
ncbi:MAG: aminopeptidase [Phenylobacterium zucineum]|nr:MAG: aminopeptidase [Phenylobacterium zucineum]